NWINIFGGYVYDIEAKPGSNSTFYISTKNDNAKRPEIFKSSDNGATWSLMDNGFYNPSDLSVATVYGCKIAVTPADPDRLYAGVIATGKPGDNGWIGIYYSLDGGATWQEDSGFDGGPYASGSDMNTNWYVAGYSSGYHQGWYNFDLDASHIDPDKIWIGTIWFCESGNKGGNIEYIRGTRSLSMHADIQDIDVHGNEIWVASDGGINFSNDEFLTTETRMDGIYASDFWGFSHGWNLDTWTGGRYHNGNGAYHANYGLGNTKMLGGAEAPTGYINPFNSLNAHYSDISDRKISSSLNMASSTISNLEMYPSQSYFHFEYSEVEWHPNYANVLYLGNEQVLHYSDDGGLSFTPLYEFPGEIKRFEISKQNPEIIYAIIKEDYWTWNIFKSENGGVSFNILNRPNYS
ncbi:MAG: sialidase family protein, partial [Bacteroidota bacterium]